MTVMARLIRWLTGRSLPLPAVPNRRERRAAARDRHHETGESPWSPSDLQEGPPGKRWVADVAPGTPGHFGSVRTIDDD